MNNNNNGSLSRTYCLIEKVLLMLPHTFSQNCVRLIFCFCDVIDINMMWAQQNCSPEFLTTFWIKKCKTRWRIKMFCIHRQKHIMLIHICSFIRLIAWHTCSSWLHEQSMQAKNAKSSIGFDMYWFGFPQRARCQPNMSNCVTSMRFLGSRAKFKWTRHFSWREPRFRFTMTVRLSKMQRKLFLGRLGGTPLTLNESHSYHRNRPYFDWPSLFDTNNVLEQYF